MIKKFLKHLVYILLIPVFLTINLSLEQLHEIICRIREDLKQMTEAYYTVLENKEKKRKLN